MKEEIKNSNVKRRKRKNTFDCNNYQKLLLAILRTAWCDTLTTATDNKLKYITNYEDYSKEEAYEFMSGIKNFDDKKAKNDKEILYLMEEMFNLCCNNLGIEPSYFRRLFFQYEKYFLKNKGLKPDKIFNSLMKKMIENV